MTAERGLCSEPGCQAQRARGRARGREFVRDICWRHIKARNAARKQAHELAGLEWVEPVDPLDAVAVVVDEPADEPLPLPVAGQVRTIVIISDVHVPEHDRAAVRCALAVVAALRPDEVILAGDILELSSVSQHGGVASPPQLADDLAAGRRFLRAVRDAAGAGATLTYLEGNHETRLSRYLASRAPSVAASLALPEALGLDDLGIRWVPEGAQPIERGTMRVYHGHQDIPRPPQHHAARVALLRGRRGSTVVYGHTHIPQTATVRGEDSAVAVGLGCLRTLGPRWLHGYASGWRHGLAVAYVRASGVADVYPVSITHGVAAYGGRLYGGADAA